MVCLLLIVVLCLSLFIWWRIQSQPLNPAQSLPAEVSTISAATSTSLSYAGKYCYAGEPRPTSTFNNPIIVLTNTGYLVGYDDHRKNPAWVCYRLFKVDNLQASPRPQNFSPDPRTITRVRSSDYTGSGYDRGHMAPNYGIAVCYGSKAQLETFLTSNIIPQRPHLNRGIWENLESTEIRVYAQKFNVIWVVDGPVPAIEQKRLKSGIEIPAKCYKIIIREEEGFPKVLAFLMPQDTKNAESPNLFLASVREVEKETGLDFLNELPATIQDKIERTVATTIW